MSVDLKERISGASVWLCGYGISHLCCAVDVFDRVVTVGGVVDTKQTTVSKG